MSRPSATPCEVAAGFARADALARMAMESLPHEGSDDSCHLLEALVLVLRELHQSVDRRHEKLVEDVEANGGELA